MEKAQEIYRGEYNVDITTIVSTSSLALKIFRTNYLKLNIPVLNKNLDTFVRLGYFGGATDFYLAECEDLKYYDVNSLYPYAMKNYMRIKPTKVDKIDKQAKIATKAFTFHKFNGKRDAPTIIAWLSHLDEYFDGEIFFEHAKVKCASNHLIDDARIWWDVRKQTGRKPKTWSKFQHLVKKNFMPPIYHSNMGHKWERLAQNENEYV